MEVTRSKCVMKLTHFVAHRLELAELDAIKFDDDYLELFDSTINGIFKFYHYSTVRRKENFCMKSLSS